MTVPAERPPPTSFLRPPFGFSLFFVRGVAPAEVRTEEIYRGVTPFVALQRALR